MAKTVTIGKTAHLSVGNKHLSPLCGAAYRNVAKGRRTSTRGDVTCSRCKKTLELAVKNALA
jgi:hypothetical protein